MCECVCERVDDWLCKALWGPYGWVKRYRNTDHFPLKTKKSLWCTHNYKHKLYYNLDLTTKSESSTRNNLKTKCLSVEVESCRCYTARQCFCTRSGNQRPTDADPDTQTICLNTHTHTLEGQWVVDLHLQRKQRSTSFSRNPLYLSLSLSLTHTESFTHCL